MELKQQQCCIWYFLAENLAHSDFEGLLKGGRVADLTLGERIISGLSAVASGIWAWREKPAGR